MGCCCGLVCVCAAGALRSPVCPSTSNACYAMHMLPRRLSPRPGLTIQSPSLTSWVFRPRLLCGHGPVACWLRLWPASCIAPDVSPQGRGAAGSMLRRRPWAGHRSTAHLHTAPRLAQCWWWWRFSTDAAFATPCLGVRLDHTVFGRLPRAGQARQAAGWPRCRELNRQRSAGACVAAGGRSGHRSRRRRTSCTASLGQSCCCGWLPELPHLMRAQHAGNHHTGTYMPARVGITHARTRCDAVPLRP